MGRATRRANDRANPNRMAEVEQHVAWLILQGPLVEALKHYVGGCRVYSPDPGEWRPGRVYHKIEKGVLVPDVVEEEITIPAGYRKIYLVKDHGRPMATTLGDPDERGIANNYMLELVEGFELVLPGGKQAKLVKHEVGGYAVEEQNPE